MLSAVLAMHQVPSMHLRQEFLFELHPAFEFLLRCANLSLDQLLPQQPLDQE
jgi:hypothetical protein